MCQFFGNEPIDDYKFWHAMTLARQELEANQSGPRQLLCKTKTSGCYSLSEAYNQLNYTEGSVHPSSAWMQVVSLQAVLIRKFSGEN